MRRIIGRIGLIIFLLVICWNNFCYADVIVLSPFEELMLYTPLGSLMFLGTFIGIIVLSISLISFFSLKGMVKTQGQLDQQKKEENIQKLEKKKNGVYVWTVITFTICIILISFMFNYAFIVPFFSILGFIISIIVRKMHRKADSNAICIMTVIFICAVILEYIIIPSLVKK